MLRRPLKFTLFPYTTLFRSHRDCYRFEFEQLFVVDRERFFDFAFHAQPPSIPIDRRNWKMRTNVKRFSRREESLQLFKRHLKIQRAFATHNFAADELLRSFVHVRRTAPNKSPRRARSRYKKLRSGLGQPQRLDCGFVNRARNWQTVIALEIRKSRSHLEI